MEALTNHNGTLYGFGNIIDTLYAASGVCQTFHSFFSVHQISVVLGSSQDHAYGSFGTKLAFTFEFRAGEDPPSRYILPPEEILPNSEEVLVSLMALITKAKELGYFST